MISRDGSSSSGRASPAPKKGDIWYESWKEVEAEYHCKLKFTKVSYSVAVTKMTAAGPVRKSECDIWNAQWYDTFPSFCSQGDRLTLVRPISL